MKLSKNKINLFQRAVWDFYKNEGRSFAWRNVQDPYLIVISEVMLQQTQTTRVVDKFEQFIKRFPDFRSLAIASLYEVLRVWQGLGYNRRGKYLHEIAKKVVMEYREVLPADQEILITFPGIGAATAASICAFAFNSPTVFIETNIRTVFIHFFFQDEVCVHDREILLLVAQTLEKSRPREWYYALMDYGVMLKRTANVSNRKSAHYTKQSRFEGSDRQIRGAVIRTLTKRKKCQLPDLVDQLGGAADRVERIVADLQKEGLVRFKQGYLSID